jgi:hypothetical protein
VSPCSQLGGLEIPVGLQGHDVMQVLYHLEELPLGTPSISLRQCVRLYTRELLGYVSASIHYLPLASSCRELQCTASLISKYMQGM